MSGQFYLCSSTDPLVWRRPSSHVFFKRIYNLKKMEREETLKGAKEKTSFFQSRQTDNNSINNNDSNIT